MKATLTACPGRLTLSQLKSELSELVGGNCQFWSPRTLNLPNLVEHLKTPGGSGRQELEQKIVKLVQTPNFSSLASAALGPGVFIWRDDPGFPLDRRSGPEGRSRPSQCRCATANSGRSAAKKPPAIAAKMCNLRFLCIWGSFRAKLSHLEGITQPLVERTEPVDPTARKPRPPRLKRTLTNRKALIKLAQQLAQKLKRRFSSSSTGNRDWEHLRQNRGPLTDWMVDIPTDSGGW